MVLGKAEETYMYTVCVQLITTKHQGVTSFKKICKTYGQAAPLVEVPTEYKTVPSQRQHYKNNALINVTLDAQELYQDMIYHNTNKCIIYLFVFYIPRTA